MINTLVLGLAYVTGSYVVAVALLLRGQIPAVFRSQIGIYHILRLDVGTTNVQGSHRHSVAHFEFLYWLFDLFFTITFLISLWYLRVDYNNKKNLISTRPRQLQGGAKRRPFIDKEDNV
jgi:hypothetical protein